jgi:hypothetical protein
MKTTRLEKGTLDCLKNGFILNSYCGDELAIFILYHQIKRIEFNKHLLSDSGYYKKEEDIIIITKHDEYYILEDTSSKLRPLLETLLEKIN